MNQLIRFCIAWIILGMAFVVPASAQGEGELILKLSRDFGYSSGTGRIQGSFSMKVSGPDNLQRVVFLIDDINIGEDSEAPYAWQFHTGDYALGVHTLSALGYTSDGRELHSNVYRHEFVSAEEGWQSAMKFVIPIFGIALAAILFSFVLPVMLGKRGSAAIPLGAPRTYGLLGGTICPKCRRTFGMHIWGMNLVVGKLDRCPHCGKWSYVRRVSAEQLMAAEAAELKSAQGDIVTPAHSLEEKLHKELDDSRYIDL